MSRFYPKERKLTNKDVEAYAQACWDLLIKLEISEGGGKMYDPLTIEGKTAHSYIFDLWSGGRHHKFNSLEELKDKILEETFNLIYENTQNKK